MPESTLSLTFEDLQKEVGFFLGFGRNLTIYSDEQAESVEACIRAGLRSFYNPGPSQGMSTAYEWSFMRPTYRVVLPADSLALSLPDDFGGMDGMVYYAGTDSALPAELPIVGEGIIFSKKSLLPNATGRPFMAAIRPLRVNSPTHGQRFEMIFWPTPSQEYTLTFTYYVLPEALSDSRPYPYGGMAHAETIRESCLAQAEQLLDDSMGVHTAKFQQCLAASISADRRYKATEIGLNLDRSDRQESNSWRGRYPHGWSSVSVYGEFQ